MKRWRRRSKRRSLNPRSSLLRGYAGAALHYAGRYAEAARMYEGTLQLDSQYTRGVDWPVQGLHGARPVPAGASMRASRCAKTGAAEPPFVESQLVQIYADAGRPREARRHLDRLLKSCYKAAPSGDTAFWIALAYASLDDRDGRFRWLDDAIARRSSRLLYARVDSRLNPLRTDPRYAEREAKMDAANARE